MDFSKISKKGKTLRLLLMIYMVSGLFFILIGMLFNYDWIWVGFTIFFSSWGINFATLNEQETLPTTKEEAGNIAALCWLSGWVGFISGFMIIFGSLIDSELEILRVLAFGFFTWGTGGFIGIRRNLDLLRELQGIKVKK